MYNHIHYVYSERAYMKIATYVKPTLKDNPSRIAIIEGLKNLHGFDVFETERIDKSVVADAYLVFGGDGTMLYAGVNSPCKILGINLGNVGFLAEFEANSSVEEIAKALQSAPTKERGILKGKVGGKEFSALNDFTVRSAGYRPVNMTLYTDGKYVDKYHADGLIVSTPTGSTAYSLSAGGPVLAPDVEGIVVNPVCPHSLHSRALVLSPKSIVEIIPENDDAVAVADGNEVARLKGGERITLTFGEDKAVFIENSDHDFYKKLLEKMNRWGVTD